jgi:hypothetical protein
MVGVALDKASRKMLNKLVKESSDFKLFNRFRYKSPKGYTEYNDVVFRLATELFVQKMATEVEELKQPTKTGKVVAEMLLYSLNQSAIKGFRPYWLSKDLAKAFLETTPPKDYEFQTKNISGVIFLPCHTFLLADNDPIEWMFFHLETEFELIYVCPRKNADLLLVRNRITQESFIPAVGQVQEKPLTINPLTAIDEDKELYLKRLTEGWSNSAWANLSPRDKVINVIVQTLLYIENYEQDINLSYHSPTERKRFKASGANSHFPCLMVGENYKLKTSDSIDGDCITHSKKSTHWRSGYWRNQQYGTRTNPMYKAIWIEPVLVNGTKKP